MRVITHYEADDGTRFDDRLDCEHYELKQAIAGSSIKLIGYDKKLLSDPETDETYNSVETVIVNTEADVEVISKIYGFAGFYREINAVGSWTWNNEDQEFQKIA